MTDQHPITPPPKLVREWNQEATGIHFEFYGYSEFIATRAAQWGADQELEAVEEEIIAQGWVANSTHRRAQLRAARRPKPSSLNSIALQMLGTIERDAHYIPEITDTIRRALEALPND
jgi:hypothetical protein